MALDRKLERKLEGLERAKERQFSGGLSANLNVMLKAAQKAGMSLIHDFNELENLQISVKAPGDFVSSADRNSERILHQELGRARPEYGFLMEESGAIEGKDTSHRFIIDPLDGTSNFLHAVPIFCISIALERNREIINAVTYNPVSGEMFFAEKGSGAFQVTNRGNKRLRVSGRKNLKDTVFVSPVLYKNLNDDSYKTIKKITDSGSKMRIFGADAQSLAYVAAGKVDAFWSFRMPSWDIAAGILMVKEAGGKAVNLETDGSKDKDLFEAKEILLCSEAIYDKFRQLL